MKLFRFNDLTIQRLYAFLLFTVIGSLLTGCLFKSSTIPIRHFVLTPSSTNAPSSAGHLSVEVGFVKMPAYLQRSSLAVRTGANEIDYLEGAQWAERLDQSFQRALAADLSHLLPPQSGTGSVDRARLFVTVQQFDVDTRGEGILIAEWRLSTADADLKTGEARLVRAGPSPGGKPEVIAATLSELVAELSQNLSQSIRAQ
jgi:uncharacterized lipoprotein YmbA